MRSWFQWPFNEVEGHEERGIYLPLVSPASSMVAPADPGTGGLPRKPATWASALGVRIGVSTRACLVTYLPLVSLRREPGKLCRELLRNRG